MAFLLATPAVVSALVLTGSALAYWYTSGGELIEVKREEKEMIEVKSPVKEPVEALEEPESKEDSDEALWIRSRRGLKRRCTDSFVEDFQGIKGVRVELDNPYSLLQSSALYEGWK